MYITKKNLKSSRYLCLCLYSIVKRNTEMIAPLIILKMCKIVLEKYISIKTNSAYPVQSLYKKMYLVKIKLCKS